MFFVEGLRCVGIVLFDERLNLFSPFGGIIFPNASDTTSGCGYVVQTTASDG